MIAPKSQNNSSSILTDPRALCKLLRYWEIFFQNIILFNYIVPHNCNISIWLIQYNEYLFSTADTDGLVLYH